MTKETQMPDPSLTPEQRTKVAQLTEAEIRVIDEAAYIECSSAVEDDCDGSSAHDEPFPKSVFGDSRYILHRAYTKTNTRRPP